MGLSQRRLPDNNMYQDQLSQINSNTTNCTQDQKYDECENKWDI